MLTWLINEPVYPFIAGTVWNDFKYINILNGKIDEKYTELTNDMKKKIISITMTITIKT